MGALLSFKMKMTEGYSLRHVDMYVTPVTFVTLFIDQRRRLSETARCTLYGGGGSRQRVN